MRWGAKKGRRRDGACWADSGGLKRELKGISSLTFRKSGGGILKGERNAKKERLAASGPQSGKGGHHGAARAN